MNLFWGIICGIAVGCVLCSLWSATDSWRKERKLVKAVKAEESGAEEEEIEESEAEEEPIVTVGDKALAWTNSHMALRVIWRLQAVSGLDMLVAQIYLEARSEYIDGLMEFAGYLPLEEWTTTGTLTKDADGRWTTDTMLLDTLLPRVNDEECIAVDLAKAYTDSLFVYGSKIEGGIELLTTRNEYNDHQDATEFWVDLSLFDPEGAELHEMYASLEYRDHWQGVQSVSAYRPGNGYYGAPSTHVRFPEED